LNPDGSINVLPDAPVGVLTMTYQICEKLNTTNCDTAVVTVTIEAPSMTVSGQSICTNDVPYLSYTTTANNFNPLNGLTITWTDSNNNVVSTMTNLPLNGQVLWPGAVVDANGNGIDWPGWLLVNGQWIEGADGFENLRPTATVAFTLNPTKTIVVSYPPSTPYCTSRPVFTIDAVNDTAETIDGLTGATNVLNVFTNDTLNTVVLNPDDVNLILIVPDPTGSLILNPNGSIDVNPNTPSGTYVLTYQICEKADEGNCDSAIVTITVVNTPLIIQAINDTFNVTQCSISNEIRSALANDLINGLPASANAFKFKLLTALSQYIKIDNIGNVTFENGVVTGQYTFDYQICETANPTNCSTATITINVEGIESVSIFSATCNADTTPVDLKSLLPQGVPTNGTWIDIDNTGGLNGNILNAFEIPINVYKYEYKIGGDCPRSIILNLDINDDCIVLACKTIIVHNAFSSNEDGRNDFFEIENIEDNVCYRKIRVEIYNRWGVLVFEKDNYNNKENAFRGRSEGRTTINKNEGLPTGTYFYILSYETDDNVGNPTRVKKDGFLYLVK
jgi:gliding motility-associated-like protein